MKISEQLSKRGDSHCKACDNTFIARWRPEYEVYEDLCPICLQIAMGAARTDTVVYENCLEEWSQGELDTDSAFVESFQEATLTISGDLLSDDPYHEYGEEAMGELGYFDKY